MTPFECYCEYLALKRHFTSNYNYHMYNGKINATERSFAERNDKYFFEKLARHRDPHGLLLSNLLINPKAWIRELAYSEKAEAVYLAWLKKKQSLGHMFSNDMKKLDPDFNRNLKVPEYGHPPLLVQYISHEIELETFAIVVMVTQCYGYWDSAMKDDPLWESTSTLIKKYYPFLGADATKFKGLMLKHFAADK